MSDPKALRLRLAAEDLGSVLERLTMLHECLAKLLEEKERHVCDSNIEALEDLREREEVALLAIVDEEKERQLITEEIGDLLELEDPAAMKIDELLPELDAGSRERLTAQRDALRGIAGRMRDQSSKNRVLIEHSLGHVRLFLSQMSAAAMSTGTYGATGTNAASGDTPILTDRRG